MRAVTVCLVCRERTGPSFMTVTVKAVWWAHFFSNVSRGCRVPAGNTCTAKGSLLLNRGRWRQVLANEESLAVWWCVSDCIHLKKKNGSRTSLECMISLCAHVHTHAHSLLDAVPWLEMRMRLCKETGWGTHTLTSVTHSQTEGIPNELANFKACFVTIQSTELAFCQDTFLNARRYLGMEGQIWAGVCLLW